MFKSSANKGFAIVETVIVEEAGAELLYKETADRPIILSEQVVDIIAGCLAWIARRAYKTAQTQQDNYYITIPNIAQKRLAHITAILANAKEDYLYAQYSEEEALIAKAFYGENTTIHAMFDEIMGLVKISVLVRWDVIALFELYYDQWEVKLGDNL